MKMMLYYLRTPFEESVDFSLQNENLSQGNSGDVTQSESRFKGHSESRSRGKRLVEKIDPFSSVLKGDETWRYISNGKGSFVIMQKYTEADGR
jgi:hypothetical protein